MCKNKSCICQQTNLYELEKTFLEIWHQIFTLREEAQLELQEKDRNE